MNLYTINEINLKQGKIIKNIVDKKTKEINLEIVLKLISEFTKISKDELKSKSRERKYADARKIYFTFCWEHLRASLSEIGASVMRDHATVLYSINLVPIILSEEYSNFINFVYLKGYTLERKRIIKGL